MTDENKETEKHEDFLNEQKLEQHEVHEVLVFLQNNGVSIILTLAIGVAAAFGLLFYRNGLKRKAEYAARALTDARTPEALMAVTKEYAGTVSAPIALLKLAAQKFSEGAYDEAFAKYEEFKNTYPDHGVALAAAVCMVECQEAAGKFDAAIAAADTFISDNPDHFMTPVAIFTKARCYEQSGDLEKAREVYENFMAKNSDDAWSVRADSSLRYVKQRIRAAEKK
jgi:predicted negative regulator of RcsB-dependent stress response